MGGLPGPSSPILQQDGESQEVPDQRLGYKESKFDYQRSHGRKTYNPVGRTVSSRQMPRQRSLPFGDS